MAIFETSRYETANVVPVAGADDVYRATVFPTRTVTPPDTYTVHRVIYGERLDTLAALAYGDPELWWIIADANPDANYPDDLVPGALLKIPLAVDS